MRCGFLVVWFLALQSCSFVEIDNTSELRHGSSSFDAEVFDLISVGHTDRQWVLRYIGHPDQIISLDDGGEQFIYRVERRASKGIRVFLLFDQRAVESTPEWHVVAFSQGVVADYWRRTPTLPAQNKPDSTAVALQSVQGDTSQSASTSATLDNASATAGPLPDGATNALDDEGATVGDDSSEQP